MTLDKASLKVWAPFVRLAAEEVDAKFPRRDDTGTYPGHGEIYPAKHESNRGQYAVDFMISSKAMGDKIAEYLWKNRKRLGIRYVIWYRRIISETNTPIRWRPYVNPVASRRGTASGDHTNHPHASFFSNGKHVPLKDAPAPEPEVFKGDPESTIYLDRLKPGVTGSQSVFVIQTALVKVLGTKTTLVPSGGWGPITTQAAKDFQAIEGDDVVDGLLGPYDVDALLKRAKMTNPVEEKA